MQGTERAITAHQSIDPPSLSSSQWQHLLCYLNQAAENICNIYNKRNSNTHKISQIHLEISKKKRTFEKWAKATDRRKWTIKGKSSALKVTGEIQIKIKELLYFCITLETITRSKTSRVGSDVGKQTL